MTKMHNIEQCMIIQKILNTSNWIKDKSQCRGMELEKPWAHVTEDYTRVNMGTTEN